MKLITRSLSLAALALLTLGGTAQTARAQVGYSVTNEGDNLYSIDLATGVATLIGPLGISGDYEGLSFQPGTGTLFAYDDDVNAQLVTINTATGAATAVGLSVVPIGEAGLTFAPDGTLYAADQDGELLYTLNPATGAATLVGSLGEEIDGLGFANGTLFGISDGGLFTINTATGAATLVGTNGLSNNEAGLEGDGLGNLYLLDEDTESLYLLNQGTGAATLIGNTGFRFEGLAISAPTAVPEPGSVALLVGAGIGGVMLRRRKK